MSENSDKRWWLQICPVDVHPAPKMRKNGDVDIRARRQIPVEWSNSRFSYTSEQQIPSKLKPFFRRGSQNITPNKWPRIPQRFNTVNSYSVGRGSETGIGRLEPQKTQITTTTTFPSTTTSTLKTSQAKKEEEEEATTTAIIEQRNITENPTPPTTSKSVSRRLIPLRHSRLLQFNEKARTRSTPQETTTENAKTRTQTTPINSNEPKKTTTTLPTDVLDYYDMFRKFSLEYFLNSFKISCMTKISTNPNIKEVEDF
uniref:Uncharacterized protein n=1 Tax=Meloidogyne enterolobii TaxID=390850 RepID=A0A6V7WZA0_MELEN|nr:unnamed protein product [Meloidogyne enterolobii]